MTDKVQKIREEVEMIVNRRLNLLNGDYFDLNKEADGFTNEIMDIIDSMQLGEIPPKFPLISPKKCMYTKDDFTDEDRKILCDGCEEECELNKEEPVSDDLYEAAEDYAATGEILPNGKEMISFDALKAFKAGAEWQKEKDAILPKVRNRENLDDFSYQTAYDLSNDWAKETPTWHDVEMACKLGANWQKEQMMAKAVDATVHIEAGNYPYIPQIELYDYDKDVPLAKEGDKYKVVLIKEN